jgi:hypothetical protein
MTIQIRTAECMQIVTRNFNTTSNKNNVVFNA